MTDKQPSGWAIGWAAFAAFMMIMMGGWWIIGGIVAILNDQFYVVTQNWIFQLDVTIWGWVHLILGIVILLAGFSLLSGAVWARTVGVILALVAGLAAFAWLPYYPVWAVLYIVMSVGVVWALTAHGRDITEA
jgi:hypothetical protein